MISLEELNNVYLKLNSEYSCIVNGEISRDIISLRLDAMIRLQESNYKADRDSHIHRTSDDVNWLRNIRMDLYKFIELYTYNFTDHINTVLPIAERKAKLLDVWENILGYMIKTNHFLEGNLNNYKCLILNSVNDESKEKNYSHEDAVEKAEDIQRLTFDSAIVNKFLEEFLSLAKALDFTFDELYFLFISKMVLSNIEVIKDLNIQEFWPLSQEPT